MRALARITGRLARGAVLVAGWFALFLAIGLFVAEHTGLVRRVVRDFLAAGLGSVGDDLRIADARLAWFEPGIELRGVELGPDGAWVRLDSAHVAFAPFAAGGPAVESITVRGGKFRFARALFVAIEGNRRRADAPTSLATRPRRLPTLRLETFDLEVETPRSGVLPIGRVEALLRGDENDEPELWGRLVPSLAASASDSGEVFLHGHVRTSSRFEVQATAARLPLGSDYLPADATFDAWRALAPRGLLELDASGTFDLSGATPPRATGRLRVHDGSLLVRAGGKRVEALDVDASAEWNPTEVTGLFEPHAWSGRVRARGTIDGAACDLVALAGSDAGPGARAKAWVHAPRLALGGAFLDLVGNAPEIERQWRVFEPRGSCEAWLAARWPADVRASDDWLARAQFGFQATFAGAGGMTYHGYENHRTHERDEGFPLPLERVTGRVVVAHDGADRRPTRVALVELAGDSGDASIRCSGLLESPPVDAPPDAPGQGGLELDLALHSRGLPVDERLTRALDGLSGVLTPESTWGAFRPSGGRIDVDLRLAHAVTIPWVAVELDLRFADVATSWTELPIPFRPETGRLRFRGDGREARALSFAFSGALDTAQKLTLAGRLGTDPAASGTPAGDRLDAVTAYEVDVRRASLTGEDLRTFLDAYPDVRTETAELSPKGFADVHVVRVAEGIGRPTWTRAEVTPRDPAQLTPRQFQMVTNDVRGRALIGTTQDAEGTRTRTRLVPLVGSWGKDVDVAFTARFPERDVRVYGAGIDPSSKSLLGSLRLAMSSPDERPVDTSGLEVQGALDFVGEIRLVDGAGARAGSTYRFFLHDSSLRTADGFALDHVRGGLTLDGGQMRGTNLRARLAATPVTLTDTSFRPVADGFEMEANFDAEGVPLDRDHLASFVDPRTLDALLGDLQLTGTIDVRAGRIVVHVPAQGAGGVEFRGDVEPHGLSIQLGLPVRVERAAATFEKLVYEGGRVRAKVKIKDLDGTLAGRHLAGASMLVTYVEPKLSIEDLSGRLEGGRLLPLGEDAVRRGTVFAIALEKPFGFQLALRLEDVEAAGLLRGLFPEDMATRGKVHAGLQIAGDMDHLLGIRGSGWARVLDSRLWSIPVFRALFAQLGFDDTAVFDSMAANLFVQDGRVAMRDITVRSPLLQLVGEGTLDFDGGLAYDLEVRYDLIDRLGPFTRLLYSIQNKLLSVAIRGDMARPEIAFQNPFSRLFGGSGPTKRPLPLPPPSRLPPRF